MQDPVLNRKLENSKKLLIHWRQFHDYLAQCMKGKEFTPQDEAEFLKLKSNIAILHDSFLESVEGNLSTAQGIIALVERCILLRQVSRMNPAEIKKMEIDWHEAYLLLNETIGILQEKIDKLANVSRVTYESSRAIERVVTKITRGVTNPKFQFSAAAIAIIGVLVVAPMAGVFSYDFLNKTPATAKVYKLVRGMLRNSMMSQLEFLDWEEYDPGVRQAMPNGYNKQDIPPNQTDTLTQGFFTNKQYPGLDPLDLRPEVGKAVHSEIGKYDSNGELYLFFVMTKTSGEARSLVDKIIAWKAKLPPGSEVSKAEDMVHVGRYVNVVYMVRSANPDHFTAIEATVKPK